MAATKAINIPAILAASKKEKWLVGYLPNFGQNKNY